MRLRRELLRALKLGGWPSLTVDPNLVANGL
jgi:hypothetical protein